jgi:hypothetical protein
MMPQATPAKPFSARWARREARALRHVAREGQVEALEPGPALPERKDHALDVVEPVAAPLRCCALEGPQLPALAREDPGAAVLPPGQQGHGLAIDGAGQHQAFVVVRVLADQVHAAGRARAYLGGPAEVRLELRAELRDQSRLQSANVKNNADAPH